MVRLPLEMKYVEMRMETTEGVEGRPTFRLVGGSSTESLAFGVARDLGLPDEVIDRAIELSEVWNYRYSTPQPIHVSASALGCVNGRLLQQAHL
jgi:DNA mismatch repair ATPase MutS